MSEQSLVVARYTNGNAVKGYTKDFNPNRPVFHLRDQAGEAVVVEVSDLKIVCFVKDLVGDPTHKKARKFQFQSPGSDQGKKIAVLFKDGELIVGYTLSYTPGKQGFFVFPTDTKSNNQRIYVVKSATKMVKIGLAAEHLARTTPANQKSRRAA